MEKMESGLFSLNNDEYLQIFENMDEEIRVHELVHDLDNKIIDLVFKYINPASTLNSIMSRENIIGKRATEFYKYVESIRDYIKIANEVMVTKKSKRFETNFESLNKKYSVTAFLINGLFVTIGVDITKQKEAEDQILIQADVLSQIKDAVIAVNEEDFITYWNKGAEKLYGFKFEEVQGKKFPDDINYRWLNVDDRKKAYHQLKISGEWHGQNLSTKKNGDEIYVESSIKAFNDEKGNYLGKIFIINDITKPVHIKKALEENYNRLQEAQRIGNIGNWEWDIKSNITTFSEGLYRIYGLNPGHLARYETILNMILSEDQHIINESIEKALEDHNPFQYEFRICRPDGDIRIILAQGEVITDFAGHPLKIIFVEQDITERKEIEYDLWEAKNKLEFKVEKRTMELKKANKMLETELEERKLAEEKLKKSEIDLKTLIEELKRSNDELQQFAYVTSHDLQEPLRTIASFTQLLERRYKENLDSDADEFIEYIVDATKRMQNLIKDLLEYSRITTRGKEFKLTDTGKVFENTLSNLYAAIEETNVEINYDSLPEVMADERQLAQLFQNLISNAIKFRKPDEPPKIHISARKDDENNEYVFSVSDNGIGIENQYQDRIFIVFQRLHTREEYQGTGIGLSIAKKIVERHGGKIWVESKPGKGSIFYFTIKSSTKLSNSL